MGHILERLNTRARPGHRAVSIRMDCVLVQIRSEIYSCSGYFSLKCKKENMPNFKCLETPSTLVLEYYDFKFKHFTMLKDAQEVKIFSFFPSVWSETSYWPHPTILG